ncbi:MAG: PAS domain S-box protein [Archaeoglobaceae archaeon]
MSSQYFQYEHKSKDQLINELLDLKRRVSRPEIRENEESGENLFESEEKFRKTAEAALDAIIIIDNEGKVSYWNKAAEKIFGYTSEEVRGKEMHMIIAPQRYHESYREGFRKFKDSGEGHSVGKTLEMEAVRKDGTEFPVELSISAVKLKGEWCAIGILRDITERKRVEEELQKHRAHLEEEVKQRTNELKNLNEQLQREISEREQYENELEKSLSLLYATLESTADGVLVVDRKGNIIDYNQKFLEMWQIPESVIKYRDDGKALEFVQNQLKDPNSFTEKVKEIYNQPDAVSEDLVEFKDGGIFRRYSQPMKIGDRYMGRVWSFRDITERKKAEEKLKESEEKYRTVVEQTHDAIFIYWNNRFKFVNKRVCEVTGYSVEELYNMSIWDLIHPEDRDKVSELRDKEQNEEATSLYVTRAITKSGEIRYFELALTRVPYIGRQAILGAARDITDRKEMEERIVQLNGVLRLLNKNLRHDVLNDLNVVSNSLELYTESKDEKLLENAFRSIEKSINLVKRMKELESLVSSGGSLKPYNIKDVVSNIENDYDIEVNVEGDGIVLADEALSSVVGNVIGNAIKHGEADKVDITVEEKGTFCDIKIADNGKGVSDDIKGEIFDEGFSGNGRGSGLGLYIVRKTIERYGGSIEVEDNDPRGTTFILRLQVAPDYLGVRSSLGIPLSEIPSYASSKEIPLEDDDKQSLKEKNEENKELEINLQGLKCPQPILRIHSKIMTVEKGTVLKVIADCPTFERDLSLWATKTGKSVLECIKDNGAYTARIVA